MTGSARIGVIEDEPIGAALLSRLPSKLGQSVSIAPDAAKALALLRAAGEIDPILLDRRLPDIDGLELLDAIKVDERLAR